MVKLSYTEGDLFALPLRDGGFGVGLVARSPKRGRILFGYFFNRFFATVPTVDQVAGFTTTNAIYLTRFGDLGLFDGSWQVVGQLADFDRAKWPMPPFFRGDCLTGRIAWLINYTEDDPGREIRMELCDPCLTNYPNDGLAGSGFVELTMTRLLNSQPAEKIAPDRSK